MSNEFTKSIADKPIQWLGVLAGITTIGYFVSKKIAPNREKAQNEQLVKDAEVSVSVDNPFSYTAFLSQKLPSGTPLLTISAAQKAAKQIYDSLNTYFSDSEDICVGVFKSLSSKVKVAQVAQQFFALYGKDILVYLKNGNKTFSLGFTGGLSQRDYEQVLAIVNNKSKF
jgi:hypothetical protein